MASIHKILYTAFKINLVYLKKSHLIFFIRSNGEGGSVFTKYSPKTVPISSPFSYIFIYKSPEAFNFLRSTVPSPI